ncbi:MAG TPA: YifB family Mg chelatase-like AAA ATPase [Anaerovoracaceae bacterium]|nr:YifB family Mg chelatase-like AAA ATPase [Anaerovoracaceae bacterium]
MYSQVKSGALYGLASEQVVVETDLSPGLPAFNVVGLPDATVREAKERIRAAIVNSGFKFPAKRITINLVPAGTKKEGTHFDLPIAVGVMIAIDLIRTGRVSGFAFLGELSLDGSVNRINGALPLVIGLRNHGVVKIILPMANAEEASAVDDVVLYPVKNLWEIAAYFDGGYEIKPWQKSRSVPSKPAEQEDDFCDVAGQESVKRALQIAAAASHNVLLIGPPGSGKTMMARRMAGILPAMTYEEKLEVTKIYSIAGELSDHRPMITARPFRSPHHTLSGAALVGGGSNPKPGEVSLAHHGVLFLDELPEYKRYVLEMLRQPLEDERVTISRIRGTVSFPAKFMLLAAMNLCPCGHYSDPTHECTCTPWQIRSYLSKLSGPLLDRIDMHIEIMPVKYRELIDMEPSDPDAPEPPPVRNSEIMRQEVEAARQIQLERYKNEEISYNSQLTPGLIKKYCMLDRETKRLLETAFHQLSLSARAHHKIIKLGRTIADMEGAERIGVMHIAEAVRYRSLDKMYRGL